LVVALYSTDGNELNSFNDLQSGGTYVAVGKDNFEEADRMPSR
jgi:hypothetical protein